MRKLILSLTLSLLVFSGILFSQITSGVITMNMTDVHISGTESKDEVAEVRSRLRDMNMVIYFRPGEQVTEMNKMMGTIDIKTYFKDGHMTRYQDNMGQKLKIITPLENVSSDSLDVNKSNMQRVYDISYDRESSIDIIGYECYKANINMDMDVLTKEEEMPTETKEMNMVWYITEEIQMDNFQLEEMPGLVLQGTPLHLSVNMGNMTMTFEATNIETSVENSAFEEPIGDYKVLTPEELKQIEFNVNGNR